LPVLVRPLSIIADIAVMFLEQGKI